MSKKPCFCLNSKGHRIRCGSCGELIEDIDFDADNPEKADEITKRMTVEKRVKECFGCSHKIYLCKDCKDEETAICACCLEEEVDDFLDQEDCD